MWDFIWKNIIEQIKYSNRAAPVYIYIWHGIPTGIAIKSRPAHYSRHWRITQFTEERQLNSETDESTSFHLSHSELWLCRRQSQVSTGWEAGYTLHRLPIYLRANRQHFIHTHIYASNLQSLINLTCMSLSPACLFIAQLPTAFKSI